MYEIPEDTICQRAEQAQLPEDEFERFLFIDLTDSQGWPELETALPEGAVDDLTGNVV
ncbi:MAG TPA: hypothetical protein VG206_12165 [Terriglobia bacterium]|nr:hypothetical protein [Terriglobia bacterium]